MNDRRHGLISSAAATGLVRSATCSLVLACLGLAGCGSRLPTITGHVTYRGLPLDTGRVVFHPQGSTAPAYAVLQPGGTYSAQTGSGPGIAEGDYSVTVMATAPVPEPSVSNPRPEITSLIPERYGNVETSGLKVTVGPGKNVFDVQLED